jgi:hypothetical protein
VTLALARGYAAHVRDYDDDDLSPDPWDAGSRDLDADELDALSDPLHSGFAQRDLEDLLPGKSDEDDEPREYPRESRPRDPAMAKLAMDEMHAAIRSVPRGRAPEIRALSPERRRAGVCCVLVICCDGRKVVLR